MHVPLYKSHDSNAKLQLRVENEAIHKTCRNMLDH